MSVDPNVISRLDLIAVILAGVVILGVALELLRGRLRRKR